MTTDLAADFASLQNGVRRALRNCDHVRVASARDRLQLLVFPSLVSIGNPWSLDFFESKRRDEAVDYVATHTIWRSHVDARAFESLVLRLSYPKPFRPTIEVQELDLASAEIEQVLLCCRGVRLPIYVEASRFGLDGVDYELWVGEPWNNLQVVWWNRLPEDWFPLADIVNRMTALSKLGCRGAKESDAPPPKNGGGAT